MVISVEFAMSNFRLHSSRVSVLAVPTIAPLLAFPVLSGDFGQPQTHDPSEASQYAAPRDTSPKPSNQSIELHIVHDRSFLALPEKQRRFPAAGNPLRPGARSGSLVGTKRTEERAGCVAI
jgi:hypothetical protein